MQLQSSVNSFFSFLILLFKSKVMLQCKVNSEMEAFLRAASFNSFIIYFFLLLNWVMGEEDTCSKETCNSLCYETLSSKFCRDVGPSKIYHLKSEISILVLGNIGFGFICNNSIF